MTDLKRRSVCASIALTLPVLAGALSVRAAGAAHINGVDDLPPSIVDDRGHTLILNHQPQRLATISYFGADTGLALGIKPVASTFLVRGRAPVYLCGHMNDVRDLGQRASANLELLASTRCDLIIAMRRYTEAHASRLERIAPYLALDLETFNDSDRSIALVGAALGKQRGAMQLNRRFAQTLARYRAGVPRNATRPRYLFIWGTGTAPWAFYDENMTCSLLNAIGGVNAAGRNPMPARRENTAFQISLETMLLADPQLIFVYDDGPAEAFESNPVWQHLNAVRQARVVRVGDHWIESFGPIAREAVLAEAAHALYPRLFPPVDLCTLAGRFIS
ncbi:ABC-type Fe3+-hydroxamate transport system, substrate-binding protein [Burkholderia sp. OK233]|nr:ABC-type Fe3+-hydroxamate transport system, substrate-binding protein [Burkholderia sp. OK233]